MELTVYEPCNEECCARQFEVCRYSQDSVSIKDLGTLLGGIDCDTVFWKSLECYNVCDYLEDFDELYPKMPEINEPEMEELFDIKPEDNSLYGSLSVLYNDQYLKVLVDKTNGTGIKIDIYNLIGELIITKSGIMKNGLNIYELDISQILSGVYLYNISIDGLSIKNGKINLVR